MSDFKICFFLKIKKNKIINNYIDLLKIKTPFASIVVDVYQGLNAIDYAGRY